MGEYRKVARVSEVPAGGGKKVEVDGQVIALFNASGTFCAVQDRCPHRGGPLSEGVLQGTQVTCPWHAWAFDVCTGNRVGFPEGMGNIKAYKVRVEGDDILVEC